MLSRALQMVLQQFWRLTRGTTLGAQGIVVDRDGQVLLVRHGYRPGWHFPGGGVESGETIQTALRRELGEETGVIVTGVPVLHGMFANFEKFPGDHIAVVVVRQWERPQIPPGNIEISETAFFSIDDLPDNIAPGARRRIAEVFHGAAPSEYW